MCRSSGVSRLLRLPLNFIEPVLEFRFLFFFAFPRMSEVLWTAGDFRNNIIVFVEKAHHTESALLRRSGPFGSQRRSFLRRSLQPFLACGQADAQRLIASRWMFRRVERIAVSLEWISW